MAAAEPYTGAAAIARLWRRGAVASRRPWSLRWQSVCTSTELGLSRWLEAQPWTEPQPCSEPQPRALFAARQLRARGQQGRVWQAPSGGVWISAALPWPDQRSLVAVFGLAVALALSEQLESYGLPVRIKWPNDLILQGRKVAGVLPRLVHRGNQVRLARIGLGLNVCNPVPREGIALCELLSAGQCLPQKWSAQVLWALERSIDLAGRTEWLLAQVEKRLWTDVLTDPGGGDPWQVLGLRNDGALRLQRGSESVIWTRWDQ
ncbi:MAG: biotin--[acetyl-CoA-carboxylase] ligase [Prochlorococcus sp.]